MRPLNRRSRVSLMQITFERIAIRFVSIFEIFWRHIRQSFVFILIVLAVLAGQLGLLWRPDVGVYIEVFTAAALMGIAVWKPRVRTIALSSAIIPIAMMITLSLPNTSNLIQSMIFYDALLVLGLVYRFMFTLDMPTVYTRLTLRGYAAGIGLMLVIGEVLGLIGYALLRHHYTFSSAPLATVAVSSAVFAITEEIFFRGLIQQRAAQIMNPLSAALLTTVLYTVVSIGHITVIATLFSLLLGATLSAIYYKKQNLILTITVNLMTKLTYIGLLATFVYR
jgi:membrane protease YdiL (CAAX protease family)